MEQGRFRSFPSALFSFSSCVAVGERWGRVGRRGNAPRFAIDERTHDVRHLAQRIDRGRGVRREQDPRGAFRHELLTHLLERALDRHLSGSFSASKATRSSSERAAAMIASLARLALSAVAVDQRGRHEAFDRGSLLRGLAGADRVLSHCLSPCGASFRCRQSLLTVRQRDDALWEATWKRTERIVTFLYWTTCAYALYICSQAHADVMDKHGPERDSLCLGRPWSAMARVSWRSMPPLLDRHARTVPWIAAGRSHGDSWSGPSAPVTGEPMVSRGMSLGAPWAISRDRRSLRPLVLLMFSDLMDLMALPSRNTSCIRPLCRAQYDVREEGLAFR